jgi:hypothetical protein
MKTHYHHGDHLDVFKNGRWSRCIIAGIAPATQLMGQGYHASFDPDRKQWPIFRCHDGILRERIP